MLLRALLQYLNELDVQAKCLVESESYRPCINICQYNQNSLK